MCTKADEVRLHRQLTEAMNKAQVWVDAAEAEVKQARKDVLAMLDELERARSAYQRRTAEVEVLNEQIRKDRETIAQYRKTLARTMAGIIQERKKHTKLFEIVKLGMTPEQYHRCRGVVMEMHPELDQ